MTDNRKASRMLAVAAALGVLSLGVAGCTEKSTVTLHEPGVYKGDKDPLLATQRDPEHIEALKERFVSGQTDR
ncbi:MAG: hypothetical protein P8Y01_00075 [Woeseiaceae bacterium]